MWLVEKLKWHVLCTLFYIGQMWGRTWTTHSDFIYHFFLSLSLSLFCPPSSLSLSISTLSTQRLISRVIKLLSRAYKSELILYSHCLTSIIVHNCHILSSYVPATMLFYTFKLCIQTELDHWHSPMAWHLHYISFLHVRKLRHT